MFLIVLVLAGCNQVIWLFAMVTHFTFCDAGAFWAVCFSTIEALACGLQGFEMGMEAGSVKALLPSSLATVICFLDSVDLL